MTWTKIRYLSLGKKKKTPLKFFNNLLMQITFLNNPTRVNLHRWTFTPRKK